MNLSGVRTGLKNVLDAVAGLNVYDYQLDAPNLPAAIVRMPATIDPRAVFGGDNWTYQIPVMLLISMIGDRSADQQLEDFLQQSGTGSVVAALSADPTLGGVCMSADVVEVTNFGYLTVRDGQEVMSCDLLVEVYT